MNLTPSFRFKTGPAIGTVALAAVFVLAGCAASATGPSSQKPDHKAQVVALLKSFENGDPKPIGSISATKYIQHNLGVGDGRASLATMLAGRPKGSTTVDTVRVFQDGDYLIAHSEYNFSGNARIGFDVFRFEGDQIVEHWDNLQAKAAQPSPGGHTMTDGPTVAPDLDRTAAKKALMQTYMDDL